jgi:transposase-like protein
VPTGEDNVRALTLLHRALARREAESARQFFRRAMQTLKVRPTEMVTDAAPVYPAVLDEFVPLGLASHRALRQQSD